MASKLFSKNSAKRLLMLAVALLSAAGLQYSVQHPADKLSEITHKNAEAFHSAIQHLTTVADEFQLNGKNQQDLQNAVSAARTSYKTVEFLLEYYYPEYVEENINGAPLFQIKRVGPRPYVVPPQGLQVLDELAYSDEAISQKTEIATLARELANKYDLVLTSFNEKQIKQSELSEAMRMELVRIFSMGVTGFDTPGSLNALNEAKISFQSLQTAMEPYYPVLSESDTKVIKALFTNGLNYLSEEVAFDDFDRLTFLKQYVDPLYGQLRKLSDKPSTKANKWGWNPNSTSLFSADFLDPYFYTELSKDEDGEELRALGQKLFYDPLLSQNNQMSCASCHNPAKGFTDAQPKSASSVEGKTVQRNAPTLLNAVYSDRYFYDLRAFTLEQQAEHVIFNHDEFNTGYEQIVAKLNRNEEYVRMAKKAFGKKEFNRTNFSKALASYVLSLQSFNSEFDQYVRGEKEELSAEVKRGFNLFMGKAACGTCHFAPTFAGLVPPQFAKNESEILGVLAGPKVEELDNDGGRLASQMYNEMAWIYEKSFKTSTVRNVEITGPYFHNGAYQTLDEVLDFYDHGGGAGLGLEVTNQTLAGDSLHLDTDEKQAIIAFMKSLTDNSAGLAY
jgi:cytochrome c peroxidase